MDEIQQTAMAFSLQLRCPHCQKDLDIIIEYKMVATINGQVSIDGKKIEKYFDSKVGLAKKVNRLRTV
jgi:hypothetical protein